MRPPPVRTIPNARASSTPARPHPLEPPLPAAEHHSPRAGFANARSGRTRVRRTHAPIAIVYASRFPSRTASSLPLPGESGTWHDDASRTCTGGGGRAAQRRSSLAARGRLPACRARTWTWTWAGGSWGPSMPRRRFAIAEVAVAGSACVRVGRGREPTGTSVRAAGALARPLPRGAYRLSSVSTCSPPP